MSNRVLSLDQSGEGQLVSRRHMLGMMTATGAFIATRPTIALASSAGPHRHLYSVVDSATHGGPVALISEDGGAAIRKLVVSDDGQVSKLGAVVQKISKENYWPISLSTVDGDVGSTVGSSGRLTTIDHGESSVPLDLTGDELEEPNGPFTVDTGNVDFIETPSHSDNDGDFNFDGWPGCAVAKSASRLGSVAVILHPAYADGDHFDHVSVLVGRDRHTLSASGPVIAADIQPAAPLPDRWLTAGRKSSKATVSRSVRISLETASGGLEVWERNVVSGSFEMLDQLSGLLRGSAGFAASGELHALTGDSQGAIDAHTFTGRRWTVRQGIGDRTSSNFVALPIQMGSQGRWVTSALNIVEVKG